MTLSQPKRQCYHGPPTHHRTYALSDIADARSRNDTVSDQAALVGSRKNKTPVITGLVNIGYIRDLILSMYIVRREQLYEVTDLCAHCESQLHRISPHTV